MLLWYGLYIARLQVSLINIRMRFKCGILFVHIGKLNANVAPFPSGLLSAFILRYR